MRRLLKLCVLPLLALATAHAGELSPEAREALEALSAGARESHSDGFLVMHRGEVLAELPAGGGEPMETMSVTKSVVALAVGRLLALGRLDSLDVPVHAFYPEWKQGSKQQVTVRHLLENTSGLQNLPSPGVEIYPAPDVIQLALAAELSHPPGSRFSYNNKAVNLLAGVIAKACGAPMDACVQTHLLDPLGVKAAPWYKDAAGNPHAMAGLGLDARALARIGQLVLQRGEWQGSALIAPEFIDAMLAQNPKSPDVGLLWWRRPAWTRLHADAESIASLERVGLNAEVLDPLRQLVGRRFDSPEVLYRALEEVLGPEWANIWRENLVVPHGIGFWRPFHPEKGPVERFEAEGSLGQYVIVIPKADLVVVRQIRARDEMPAGSDYTDISARAQVLADALVAEASGN